MNKRLVILCIAISLLLAACAPQTDAPAPQPAASASPTPAPTPEPTPYAVNPVSAFYEAYETATDGDVSAFCAQLAQSGEAASLEALMAVYAHFAQLSAVRVSIGRLTQGGSADYNDTLLGAASGSGNMRPDADGVYVFSFTYDDGAYMQGSFDETSLSFTLHPTETEETVTEDIDAETGDKAEIVTTQTIVGDAYCEGLLARTGTAWVSCVRDERRISALYCGGGLTEFLQLELGADEAVPPLVYDTLRPRAQTAFVYANGRLTYSGQNLS